MQDLFRMDVQEALWHIKTLEGLQLDAESICTAAAGEARLAIAALAAFAARARRLAGYWKDVGPTRIVTAAQGVS
jgi:hypothetical protein